MPLKVKISVTKSQEYGKIVFAKNVNLLKLTYFAYFAF